MRSLPSVLVDLADLLDTTAQCLLSASIAMQRAQSYVDHYRISAEAFKRQAERSRIAEVRAMLLRMAARYEHLARLTENRQQTAEGAPDPVLDFASQPKPLSAAPAAASRKQTVEPSLGEDPVSQARRHVAEAEMRVARQRALIERLSSNPKYSDLTTQARAILETLQTTLSLAREHLELELSK